MTAPPLPTQPVTLHPLTYLDEGAEVVVGRADIDSYGIFPADGAALLRRLADGLPPAAAARWYEDTYRQPVDLAEFLDVLADLGFLAGPGEVPSAAGPVRWQRASRWLFSAPAWVAFGLLVSAAATAVATHPRLAPRPGNLFFTRYLTVLELALFAGQFPLVGLHEAAHALAGRRLGLRSTLRLGRRLHYLVFETSLDGLVAVPRRQRYLPMLAGMLADVLVVAALTVAAAATLRPDGSLPLAGGLCLALAYTTVLRFCWQFFFYLQTDLYHVVVTVLGCVDLQAAARRILADRAHRLLRRPRLDTSGLHPRDLAVGRWYSWLLLAGYAFSLGTLATAVVPVAARLLGSAFGRLVPGRHPWHQVADAAVFLGLNLAELAVLSLVALRDRRTRPRRLT